MKLQADRNTLEHAYYEIVTKVYRSIYALRLDKFTHSLIDALWNNLNSVVYDLERLPEPAFKELIGVIDGLTEARNELRLGRFLFDLEEINAVHRLVMRNKAVLRCRNLLCKILQIWPTDQ